MRSVQGQGIVIVDTEQHSETYHSNRLESKIKGQMSYKVYLSITIQLQIIF